MTATLFRLFTVTYFHKQKLEAENHNFLAKKHLFHAPSDKASKNTNNREKLDVNTFPEQNILSDKKYLLIVITWEENGKTVFSKLKVYFIQIVWENSAGRKVEVFVRKSSHSVRCHIMCYQVFFLQQLSAEAVFISEDCGRKNVNQSFCMEL